MTLDRDHFIAKFEAIPDEMWKTHGYGDADQHCVLGHCGQNNEYDTGESRALEALLPYAIRINDGYHLSYQQETPKARVLAALRDLPAPKVETPSTEITYPIITPLR